MAYLCPQVVLNLVCFELTAVVKKNVKISLKSNFLTQTYKKNNTTCTLNLLVI